MLTPKILPFQKKNMKSYCVRSAIVTEVSLFYSLIMILGRFPLMISFNLIVRKNQAKIKGKKRKERENRSK